MMSSRTTTDSLNYSDRLPLMFMGVQTRISCFKGLILFSYISVCSEFVSVFLSATLRLRNCTGKEQVVQEGCSEVSTQL
jgi:hypothetical protein